MRLSEINEAAQLVAQKVDPEAKIIFGAYYDRKLPKNQLKVTLVATGFRGYNTEGVNSLFSVTRPTSYQRVIGEEAVTSETDEVPPAQIYKPGDDSDDEPHISPIETNDDDMNGWDIPAFLRRKKK